MSEKDNLDDIFGHSDNGNSGPSFSQGDRSNDVHGYEEMRNEALSGAQDDVERDFIQRAMDDAQRSIDDSAHNNTGASGADNVFTENPTGSIPENYFPDSEEDYSAAQGESTSVHGDDSTGDTTENEEEPADDSQENVSTDDGTVDVERDSDKSSLDEGDLEHNEGADGSIGAEPSGKPFDPNSQQGSSSSRGVNESIPVVNNSTGSTPSSTQNDAAQGKPFDEPSSPEIISSNAPDNSVDAPNPFDSMDNNVFGDPKDEEKGDPPQSVNEKDNAKDKSPEESDKNDSDSTEKDKNDSDSTEKDKNDTDASDDTPGEGSKDQQDGKESTPYVQGGEPRRKRNNEKPSNPFEGNGLPSGLGAAAGAAANAAKNAAEKAPEKGGNEKPSPFDANSKTPSDMAKPSANNIGKSIAGGAFAGALPFGKKKEEGTKDETEEEQKTQGRGNGGSNKKKGIAGLLGGVVLAIIATILAIACAFALISGIGAMMGGAGTEQQEQGASVCGDGEVDGENEDSSASGDAPLIDGKMAIPAEGIFTSGYGPRGGELHNGIDIANEIGTPEYAIVDGTVAEAGTAQGYGFWVVIKSKENPSLYFTYGHMNKFHVKTGDSVRAGQHIADMASEGQSTGSHLHFRIDEGGYGGTQSKSFDPAVWLNDNGIKFPEVGGQVKSEGESGGGKTSKDDKPSSDSSGGGSSSSSEKDDKENEQEEEIEDNKASDEGGDSCVCTDEMASSGTSSNTSGGEPDGVTTDVNALTEKYGKLVIAAGKHLKMSDDDIKAALMVVAAESSFKNYANDGSYASGRSGGDSGVGPEELRKSLSFPHDDVGSDNSSVGIFQQQVGFWGKVEDLMKPGYQTGQFYAELKKKNPQGPPQVRGQAVQGSAFADGSNYAPHAGTADSLMKKFGSAKLSDSEKKDVQAGFDNRSNGNEDAQSSSSSGSDNSSDSTQKECGRNSSSEDDSKGGADSVSGSIAEKAVAEARKQIGKPYVWGAAGPDAFDCSGLMFWSYDKAGIKIGRVTTDQQNEGKEITDKSKLAPGDLIITNGSGHVMMYAGDGKIIEAQQDGVPVLERSLSEINDIVTMRRIVDKDNNKL